MKKALHAVYALLIIIIMSVSFASCEKDAGKLPNIAFKTGTGYTSADATVAPNTAVKIGINASKSEGKDVITKFTITKSVDNAAAATVYAQDVSNGDTFDYDYNFESDSSAHVDKYTFTVVNKDGIVNSVSLTLTVQ